MYDFETVVIATDGSESVTRAVDVALDLAVRFDSAVHALYVLDEEEITSSPERVRAEMQTALQERGGEAIVDVQRRAGEVGIERTVTAVVREGRPADEIVAYARETDADMVAMGTRGRHGENQFLIGSVAERVVRICPVPVLTVRQLPEETETKARAEAKNA